MGAHHFDALTRRLTMSHNRRRGLGLLGALSLSGLLAPEATPVKKKKKKHKKKPCLPCKKRKKGKCKANFPDGTACDGGICQGGSCIPNQRSTPPPAPPTTTPVVPPPPTDPCPGQKLCRGVCIPMTVCCTRDDCQAPTICCNGGCTNAKLEAGIVCSSDTACCSEYCRLARQNEKLCAATCRGKGCALDTDCCQGVTCDPTLGNCGGCLDFPAVCTSDDQCCYSDCTQVVPTAPLKLCMSKPGGPCEISIDCQSCRGGIGECTVVTRNGVTVDVCRNGVCGCPYDCCSDSDCLPAETCSTDANGLNGECTPVIGP